MVPDAGRPERILTVDHYELIGHKATIEEQSQREVGKELGHSRKTVTEALKLRLPLELVKLFLISAMTAGIIPDVSGIR
jgi:hypothetical protein